jgi:hypothetical protein
MQLQNANIGYSLYTFYETLSYDIQQQFLQELLQKQADKLEFVALYLACMETKEENDFLASDKEIVFISSLHNSQGVVQLRHLFQNIIIWRAS